MTRGKPIHADAFLSASLSGGAGGGSLRQKDQQDAPPAVLPRPGNDASRRGFTLTEMLVALAVMVLAMAMVTSVFSVTTKTAAMSAAVADVELILRNAAEELRQDLEHCDPAESILYIEGRTQAAALTEDQRQSRRFQRFLIGDPKDKQLEQGPDARFAETPPPQYSDPRADVLMFFTNRPSIARVPAQNPLSGSDKYNEFQRALLRGMQHYPIQVVYGHAAVTTAQRLNNGAWDFVRPPRHIDETVDGGSDPQKISLLPLTRWQLARRATLIYDPPPFFTGYSPRLQFNVTEMQSMAEEFPQDNRYAADATLLSYRSLLTAISPQGLPAFPQHRASALYSPYLFDGSTLPGVNLPWIPQPRTLIQNLIYLQYSSVPNALLHRYVATVLENPPAALGSNVNLRLVPGCVWFKVEILIPEDPRNSLESPLSNQRAETPRWVEVEPGKAYCFVPDSAENRELVRSKLQTGTPIPVLGSRLATFACVVPPYGVNVNGVDYKALDSVTNRVVRMWPYAIRVTMRAIDPNARLEKPITRSVVHWFR